MRENVTRSNTKQHCSVCAHNDYTRNSIGYIIFCIGTIYTQAHADFIHVILLNSLYVYNIYNTETSDTYFKEN